jgi:hypothetical protein
VVVDLVTFLEEVAVVEKAQQVLMAKPTAEEVAVVE